MLIVKPSKQSDNLFVFISLRAEKEKVLDSKSFNLQGKALL